MNHSADTAAIEKAMQDFEDELREYVKPFIEPGDQRTIQLFGEPEQRLVLRYGTASGNEVRIPADFLPPFSGRMIPPELSQRVADKKLEGGESILAEFWAFYDETMQKRHEAARRAVRQRMILRGTGPLLIAREQVPKEYWDSIPEGLQLRLSGLRDEQKIIEEMWAFRREEEVHHQQEQQRARLIAREQAMSVLRQRGIAPPSNAGGPKPTAPAFAQPSGGKPNQIPEMYREWITPEVASRLSPADIWLLRQNEQNVETAQRGKEWGQQMGESARRSTMTFQLVPESALAAESAAKAALEQQEAAEKLPLTPSPPLQIKPITNGKGKP
jgi:hypothetical protein